MLYYYHHINNSAMALNDTSKYPLVVIIGGGFGGLEVANQLKDKPVDVLMLDKHNYHTFNLYCTR